MMIFLLGWETQHLLLCSQSSLYNLFLNQSLSLLFSQNLLSHNPNQRLQQHQLSQRKMRFHSVSPHKPNQNHQQTLSQTFSQVNRLNHNNQVLIYQDGVICSNSPNKSHLVAIHLLHSIWEAVVVIHSLTLYLSSNPKNQSHQIHLLTYSDGKWSH